MREEKRREGADENDICVFFLLVVRQRSWPSELDRRGVVRLGQTLIKVRGVEQEKRRDETSNHLILSVFFRSLVSSDHQRRIGLFSISAARPEIYTGKGVRKTTKRDRDREAEVETSR